MNLLGLIFVGIGIFAICGAAFDWEWFMNHRKARLFIWIFGRTGTRIFYGLLGSGLIVFGILMTMKIIENRR